MKENSSQISRRRLIKALIATGGALAASNLPGKWAKPAVEVGVLPAHAQVTGQAVYRIGCLSDPASGDLTSANGFCISSVACQLTLASGTGPTSGVQMTVSCSEPGLFSSMPATVTTDAQGRADFGQHCITGTITDGQAFTLSFSCTDPVNGGTISGQCGTYTVVEPTVYRIDCLSVPASGSVSAQTDFCIDVAAQLVLVSGSGLVQGVQMTVDCSNPSLFDNLPATVTTDAQGIATFGGQCMGGNPPHGETFTLDFSCTDPVNGGTLTGQCGTYNIDNPTVYQLICDSTPASGGIWCFFEQQGEVIAAILSLVSGSGPVAGVTVTLDTNPLSIYSGIPTTAVTDANGRAVFPGDFCPTDNISGVQNFDLVFSCTDPVNGGILTGQCGPYQPIG